MMPQLLNVTNLLYWQSDFYQVYAIKASGGGLFHDGVQVTVKENNDVAGYAKKSLREASRRKKRRAQMLRPNPADCRGLQHHGRRLQGNHPGRELCGGFSENRAEPAGRAGDRHDFHVSVHP